MQARILRVAEEQSFERVGGIKPIKQEQDFRRRGVPSDDQNRRGSL